MSTSGIAPERDLCALLAAALEACQAAVAIAEKGKILWANSAYAELFRYSSLRELYGKQVLESAELHLNADGAKSEGASSNWKPCRKVRFVGQRKDGSLVRIENSCNPFRFGNQELLVIAAREVSESQSEAAQDGWKEEIGSVDATLVGTGERVPQLGSQSTCGDETALAQNIDAMGRLVRGIAHDFNNLLTAITLSTDLLLAGVKGQHSLRRYAEEVRLASERGTQMVRQLLSIGREETGRRVLSLNKVAEEVCKLLSRLIPENIRLEVRCSRDLGKACADSLEIQRVLLNLVLNARDAMPGGGRITITLRNLAVDEKVARTHPEVPSGDYVCLQVTDTGCGMEEHSHAHLFEPFFTTKPVGQGNGVGLNTVLGIVHRSGGRILVESRVGKGTRIRVLLPRVRAEVAPLKEYGKEEFSEFRSQIRKGRGTVLLVEDNTTVRRSIRRVLREQGYEVLAARNGTHALEVARSHPGAIDLLLTDVVMPGISGPELGSKLRDWQPAMRVIHMSAYSSDDLKRGSFSAQAVYEGSIGTKTGRSA